MVGVFGFPGYARFWVADAVSTFGTYITTVALPTLAVLTLHASDAQVGVLNGARWAPYLLFGLLAGVIADRYRRRPILVATDLVRGALLALIAALAAAGLLNIYELAVFVAVFGALSLLYDASHQSYLPRLVPPSGLTAANVRLQQTSALAQSSGPFLGGSLVALVGAPVSMLVDAVSYLASGAVLATIGGTEPKRSAETRDLRAELREGVRYVYRHPVLSSMALTLHARFLFASIISTVFPLFVLHSLGHDARRAAFGLGLVMAAGGLGALVGNALSLRLSRWGAGRAIVGERLGEPCAWTLAALAAGGAAGWAMAAGAQFLVWVALGISGPSEMAYRQSVTPDRLQGRVNATIRSLNWGMFTIGAPIAGLLATHFGYRVAMWLAIGGMAVAAVVAALSPTRTARVADGADGAVADGDAAVGSAVGRPVSTTTASPSAAGGPGNAGTAPDSAAPAADCA